MHTHAHAHTRANSSLLLCASVAHLVDLTLSRVVDLFKIKSHNPF